MMCDLSLVAISAKFYTFVSSLNVIPASVLSWRWHHLIAVANSNAQPSWCLCIAVPILHSAILLFIGLRWTPPPPISARIFPSFVERAFIFVLHFQRLRLRSLHHFLGTYHSPYNQSLAFRRANCQTLPPTRHIIVGRTLSISLRRRCRIAISFSSSPSSSLSS